MAAGKDVLFPFVEAINQAGQHAFGFCQRESAGRQSRAGHRSGVQNARLHVSVRTGKQVIRLVNSAAFARGVAHPM